MLRGGEGVCVDDPFPAMTTAFASGYDEQYPVKGKGLEVSRSGTRAPPNPDAQRFVLPFPQRVYIFTRARTVDNSTFLGGMTPLTTLLAPAWGQPRWVGGFSPRPAWGEGMTPAIECHGGPRRLTDSPWQWRAALAPSPHTA